MGLKLHNARPKSENITGLFLTPMAELKTCVAAIGGGGIAGDVIFSLFNALAMPVVACGCAAAITFLSSVDIISDKMVDRSMRRGEVKAKILKCPGLDL